MKLVIINGASCSGKSTVVETLIKEKEGYYNLSYDNIKWNFSRYEPQKFYEDIHILMLLILDSLCKLKYNVISATLHRNSRNNLIDIAQKYGYEIVEINLEAAWEVLEKRFEERIANPTGRISNTSKERFKELYDIYNAEKNAEALTLRTDVLSKEEVFEQVLKLL